MWVLACCSVSFLLVLHTHKINTKVFTFVSLAISWSNTGVTVRAWLCVWTNAIAAAVQRKGVFGEEDEGGVEDVECCEVLIVALDKH